MKPIIICLVVVVVMLTLSGCTQPEYISTTVEYEVLK